MRLILREECRVIICGDFDQAREPYIDCFCREFMLLISEFDKMKDGTKNYTSVKSIGKYAKVSFGIEPTDMVKIKELNPSRRYNRIYFVDPTQEAEMKKFFEMCAEMLHDKGEIEMILDKDVLESSKIEDIGKEVKIFLKKEKDFDAEYCIGYTLTHATAEKAKIYTFELDKTRKITTDPEAEQDSNSKEDIVQRSLVNEFGRDTSAECVGEFVGRDRSKLLNDQERTKECTSLEENHVPRETLVLPGSVVDTTNFCHPLEFDLYLSSHAGIQGTGRPTHTLAENKFIADGLQIVTKTSCYMYARSTSSDSIGGMPFASIVRRTYYAHPAAVIPMVSVQQ